MDARAIASPNLTVMLAGNKVDVTEPKTGMEPSATPSSMSSKQSNSQLDMGSYRSSRDYLSANSRWTASTAEGREVSNDITSRWASKSGIPAAMEVSAFSGENVDELFHKLARMILTKIELGEIDPDDPQSGIQYGDMNGWDGNDTDDGLRRRKKGLALGQWDQVFRKQGSRSNRSCC